MNEQVYNNDEYISGGELYKFLHISKRKMKYLLEHGYIKHIDTGKKTHRFMVKLRDAEEFKVRLETDAAERRDTGQILLQKTWQGNEDSAETQSGERREIQGLPAHGMVRRAGRSARQKSRRADRISVTEHLPFM